MIPNKTASREQTIRSWFAEWFDPPQDGIFALCSYISKISGETCLAKRRRAIAALPPAEPWEKAADTLIRDLPEKIRQQYDIEVEFNHTGPESYSAALARLLLEAQEVRKIAARSTMSGNVAWHDYAAGVRDIITRMALESGIRQPLFSYSGAKAIRVIEKALAMSGENVTADTIVKAFKRKQIASPR